MTIKIPDRNLWQAEMLNGVVHVFRDDHPHEVRLKVEGNFAEDMDKFNYARGLARQLNASHVTSERNTKMNDDLDYEECRDCAGTGMEDPDCEECDGNGWVDDPEDGGAMMCPTCLGNDCPMCGGEGIIEIPNQ